MPEIPTVTCTPVAPARRKSSAAAVVYGPTVDEPSAVIEPLSFLRLYVGPAVEPAIAVEATTVATTATLRPPRRRGARIEVSSCSHLLVSNCPCQRDGRDGSFAAWGDGE